MKRKTEPILKPSKRQEMKNLNDVLVEMQSSGNIFFLKSLKKSHIPASNPHLRNSGRLAIPSQFIREHSTKIEEWSILRIRESCGNFSRPWVVRLSIAMVSPNHVVVRFSGGWNDFVLGNRLQQGDSLIFLLKEGGRSEFEAHCFRGKGGSTPYFPDLDDGPRDEEEKEEEDIEGEIEEEENLEEEKGGFVSESEKNIKQPPAPSQMHHKDENKEAFTANGNEVKRTASQHGIILENHGQCPGFLKTLTASHIHRRHMRNTGQFEFPRRFANTDGRQLQSRVQLQGVHEDSPVYVATCARLKRRGDVVRIFLNAVDWSRFVRENGLTNGDELQFSLSRDSYFKVRKV